MSVFKFAFPSNSFSVKSSTRRRKNGELGGSNAINNLEAKLLTPLAPIEL